MKNLLSVLVLSIALVVSAYLVSSSISKLAESNKGPKVIRLDQGNGKTQINVAFDNAVGVRVSPENRQPIPVDVRQVQ